MKKFVFVLFLLLLAVNTCFADGQLTVTSKNTIIKPGNDSGMFIARVENTGDAPIYYDNGKLVIFSENDDILATENYISSSPDDILLQPGEYTYAYEFLWSSPLKNAKIGDIKFSVASDTRGYTYDQIPATAELELPGSGSFTYNYVNVTFTNTTDEIIYGAYVVCAILDRNDNVVYVDRDRYNNLGVHPGSTVTLKMYIDSDYIDYYEVNNIDLVKVDSFVYINGTR